MVRFRPSTKPASESPLRSPSTMNSDPAAVLSRRSPYDRHRALLRTRAERPRHCRAAEQSDELAPFHCSAHPVLPTKRIAHSSVRQETTALRYFKPALKTSV